MPADTVQAIFAGLANTENKRSKVLAATRAELNSISVAQKMYARVYKLIEDVTNEDKK